MGSRQPSSQPAPIRGITGTDSTYERGQVGEQVPGKDYFEIFYIHEGDVGTSTKVRGTTVCTLPTSVALCGDGYFCDLHDMRGTDLKPQHFEVIRAQPADEEEFFHGVKGPITRFLCYFKLGSPKGEDFLSFAVRRGSTILDECEGAFQKTTMRRVRQSLRNP